MKESLLSGASTFDHGESGLEAGAWRKEEGPFTLIWVNNTKWAATDMQITPKAEVRRERFRLKDRYYLHSSI
jgi:hypothetical protein